MEPMEKEYEGTSTNRKLYSMYAVSYVKTDLSINSALARIIDDNNRITKEYSTLLYKTKDSDNYARNLLGLYPLCAVIRSGLRTILNRCKNEKLVDVNIYTTNPSMVQLLTKEKDGLVLCKDSTIVKKEGPYIKDFVIWRKRYIDTQDYLLRYTPILIDNSNHIVRNAKSRLKTFVKTPAYSKPAQ